MKTFSKILSTLMLVTILIFGAVGQASASGVIYVSWFAIGANDGSSWGNAYTDLQSALSAAVSGEEIWVGVGRYKPTTTADRSATFTLKNGVSIYGGFVGGETQRSQRDWVSYVTILSGDIGIVSNATDNSYHVVTTGSTDSTAILDGFTVTDGNASGGNYPDYLGGGMYNAGGSPTLANITFNANSATSDGGGIYNSVGNPSLTNIGIIGNTTTAADGGGMYNMGGNPRLSGVAFIGNSAAHWGGGMYNENSNPNLTEVTFNSNTASTGYGGGMYNQASNPSLTTVTFTANAAKYGGGMGNGSSSNPILAKVGFGGNSADFGAGMYNLNSSPSLTDVTFDSNPSAIQGGGMYNDAGSNSTVANTTFSANSASSGGGMYNYFATPTLSNVTFNGNSALDGGGILNNSSSPSLTNATFSGNTATFGGGGIENDSSSVPMIRDSIFWGDGSEITNLNSSAPSIADSLIQGGCPAGATCNANILNANPLLGALTYNGGSAITQTMALSKGSPAINAGNDATCAATDQRGISRPQGLHCDMGAYELVYAIYTLSFASQAPKDGWVLESSKTSNKGGSMNSAATTFRLGDDATRKQYRGILSFNTASLPANAVITAVTLKLKKSKVVGGGNPVAMFKGFMVDIKTGLFGAASLQTSDFQTAASKSFGPFLIAPVSNWYNIDLTAGKAYINLLPIGSGLTQIRLHFKLDDNNNAVANYLSLFSGNASAASVPQLIITYYLP